MSILNCDVLIIGAGISGLSTLYSLRNTSLDIIVLEKKKEIGSNIQCGEVVGEYLIPFLPKKIQKVMYRNTIRKLKGISFYKMNKRSLKIEHNVVKDGSIFLGRVINRQMLEKELFTFVENNIKDIFLGNSFNKIILNRNKITDLYISDYIVRPKIVVIADGAESPVLNYLGLYDASKKAFAVSYEIATGNSDINNDYMHEFIGLSTGYSYIIPKKDGVYNVGVGGHLFYENEDELYKKFNIFLKLPYIRKMLGDYKKIKEKTGYAVIGRPTPKIQFGNCILVGDAGGNVFLPHVEGIIPSIISGFVAGKYIIETIDNDYTTHFSFENKLFSYPSFLKKIHVFFYNLFNTQTPLWCSYGDLIEESQKIESLLNSVLDSKSWDLKLFEIFTQFSA